MVLGRDPRLHEFDRLLDGTRRGERAWYQTIRRLLETAYLAASDPAAQSGKGGGLAAWELARRPIATAIHRDGTFLDIGCANGLLMESIVAWAAEAGYSIEPFGLDLSRALARLARQRLPYWADRIWAGNAMTWQPPHQFDFVRTELVYVPPGREPDLVHRLLNSAVAPGGRLLVCSYGGSSGAEPRVQPLEDLLAAWGFRTHGYAEARASNGVVITRVVWIDRPAKAAQAKTDCERA
jgi:SAM-dependent methyltransferase